MSSWEAFAGAVGASLLAGSAFAADQTINFTGVVERVEGGPGPTVVHLTDASTGRHWAMEASTRNTFVRTGFDPDHMAGVKIQVTARVLDAAAQPEGRLHMRSMTFPDGRKVFLGSAGT